MTQYSTAFSHFILGLTSVYCWLGIKSVVTIWSALVFLSIIMNSVMGVWRFGNPSYGDQMVDMYKLTSFFQDAFALPCANQYLWLGYGFNEFHCQNFFLLFIIPQTASFFAYMDSNKHALTTNITTVANCIALTIISIYYQNFYGITTVLSYILGYFAIRRDVFNIYDWSSVEIPCQDLFNYSMCFFAFFALRAMQDVHLDSS